MAVEKLVIVTKKTALEELVERFNTRAQARFYVEHLGASFADYEAAHDAYHAAAATLKAALPPGVRTQWIERAFVPNFTFGEDDAVVTLGPDGLVVNVAKYLTGQLLTAFNPDPARMDGILIPFAVRQAASVLRALTRGELAVKRISMAQATLGDGQTLLAVNDIFIGQKTHQSARYKITLDGVTENQSSSGIIVSTGAGSTGWLRSIVCGASGIVGASAPDPRFAWDAAHLCYTVREPFVSRVSSAALIFGRIEVRQTLEIVSQMPQNGVIFSDGVEEDFLEFNSGTTARIGLAERRVNLVTAQ